MSARRYKAAACSKNGAVVVYGHASQGWVIECECTDMPTAEMVAGRLNLYAAQAAQEAAHRQVQQRTAAVLGKRQQGARYIEPDAFA